MNITLLVSCAMGLETVLKYELFDLGYKELQIDNGMIRLNGTLEDACTLNLWLRTAGRVFIEIGQFNATTFDALFDNVTALPWSDWIPANGACAVTHVHSHQSELFSKSDIQAISKKAIITAIMKGHNTQLCPETGPEFPVRIAVQNNKVSVRLDTSGHGLNKRGYRSRFDAPLRETLAAGLLKLSRWNPQNDALLDPCCGSGTILIEAAMMAYNIAPGLRQTFCAESWPIFGDSLWSTARKNAQDSQTPCKVRMYGSDQNADILTTARYNIQTMGLENIFVETKDIKDIRSRFDCGKIICNPPYGIRLEEQRSTHAMYATMGKVFAAQFPKWDYYILTANDQFEIHFNADATKKRKLFNGNLRCDLYQYF